MYDRLDPIDSAWRDDFRMAKILATITNIVAAIYKEEGKEPKWSTVNDYMPIWDSVERKRKEKKTQEIQSVEEMKEFLDMFATAQNERVSKVKLVPPNFKIQKDE